MTVERFHPNIDLRKGDPFAELAAGIGISTSTAWRYVNETVALRDAAGAGCA